MVETITARRLADLVDTESQLSLIDNRPPESFEEWHVPGAKNIPYDPDDGLSADQVNRVDSLVEENSVVSICGKGLTSAAFGFELEEHKYDVSVVTGGMESWSTVYEVVPVITDMDDFVIKQIQRRAKGCLGYVVGSKRAGEAVVIDPTRQTDVFEVAAQVAGLTITGVVDTHIHADHLTGGPRLASELDVPYYLGKKATDRGVAHEYVPLSDGESLELGERAITVLHAPGHTSEMITIRIGETAILTSDTLFVDSVGRTELQFGGDEAAKGARMMYETLHETILDAPDDMTVLPGHVSVTDDGRFEGGSPGNPITETIGGLRAELDYLRLDEDAFVERLTSDAPEKPPNYETVIEINTGQTSVDHESEAIELELGPNNCAA